MKQSNVNDMADHFKGTVCGFVFLFFLSSICLGQQVIVRFDLTNADQTLKLLDKHNISDEEIRSFLDLPGTRAIVRKVNSTDSMAASSIRKAASQLPLSSNETELFQYDLIADDYKSLRLFVKDLISKQDSIAKLLSSKFQPLLPKGKNLSVNIYGVLGGYSAGWTYNTTPYTFFLGLHFKPYDIDGVINVAEHELFHNLQAVLNEENKKRSAILQMKNRGMFRANNILYTLYREGTAEYFADTKMAGEKSAAAKSRYQHLAVNAARIDDAFNFAERLTLDMVSDSTVTDDQYNHAYNILFEWNWNNPGYYVGKVMMQLLVKKHGRGYLTKCLNRDPLHFYTDFFKLTKEDKTLSSIAFSDRFESVIAQLFQSTKTSGK